MDVKLFQRTQRDLAITINFVIDEYWKDEINEQEMINLTKKLYELNRTKMVKDGAYTTIIRQQCGKKRLEVVSCILQLNKKGEKSSLSV
ncbi:TIGR04540 family protein [Amphibacillus jilinensis]|uniref:TIGR04540 family protein n=1 Tax=Amphibacillus jilinensis TaxID=1216008 RepID=UPI0002F3FA65|nr:TIGR04540 family protein [Amphibacillus jilinensis]